MTILTTLLLSLAGFAALALSMTKHHRDLLRVPPTRARTLAIRTGGWALLSASLMLSVAKEGALVGLVLWLGLVTVAALAVAMAITFLARP